MLEVYRIALSLLNGGLENAGSLTLFWTWMVRGGPSTAPWSMAKPCFSLGAVVTRARGTSTPGTMGDSPWRMGVPVNLGASVRVEARLSAPRLVTMNIKGMRMIAEIVATIGEALRNMKLIEEVDTRSE